VERRGKKRKRGERERERREREREGGRERERGDWNMNLNNKSRCSGWRLGKAGVNKPACRRFCQTQGLHGIIVSSSNDVSDVGDKRILKQDRKMETHF
jgi:hypothetical protein